MAKQTDEHTQSMLRATINSLQFLLDLQARWELNGDMSKEQKDYIYKRGLELRADLKKLGGTDADLPTAGNSKRIPEEEAPAPSKTRKTIVPKPVKEEPKKEEPVVEEEIGVSFKNEEPVESSDMFEAKTYDVDGHTILELKDLQPEGELTERDEVVKFLSKIDNASSMIVVIQDPDGVFDGWNTTKNILIPLSEATSTKAVKKLIKKLK